MKKLKNYFSKHQPPPSEVVLGQREIYGILFQRTTIVLGIIAASIIVICISVCVASYSSNRIAQRQSYQDGKEAFQNGDLETAKNCFKEINCQGFLYLIESLTKSVGDNESDNTTSNFKLSRLESDDTYLLTALKWIDACKSLEEALEEYEANFLVFQKSDDIADKLQKLSELDEIVLLPEDYQGDVWGQTTNEREDEIILLPDDCSQAQKWKRRALYVQAKANYQLSLNLYWNSILAKTNKEKGRNTEEQQQLSEFVSANKSPSDYSKKCKEKLKRLFEKYQDANSESNRPFPIDRHGKINDLLNNLLGVIYNANEQQTYSLIELLADEYFPPDDYYHKALYLEGCYFWKIVSWDKGELNLSSEYSRQAIASWLVAAYYGNKDAAEQLSELFYYESGRYCIDGSLPNIKKDNDTSIILADYAARKLGNPHAYTVLARIKNDDPDNENIEESPKELLQAAYANGDPISVPIYVIILAMEGTDAETKLDEAEINSIISVETADEPYTLACRAKIHFEGDEIKSALTDWKNSAEKGCEVAAFRLAEYYKKSDKELCKLYAELALHQRDINFNRAWEYYEKFK